MSTRLLSLVRLVGVLLLAAGVTRAADRPADLPKFKHDHLNIYPVAALLTPPAKALVVDGDLAEWPAASFVTMYADPELKDVYRLQLALAYDEQGLLVAARYIKKAPQENRIDPKVDPFRGWDGDSLQLRVISDAALATAVPPDRLNDDPTISNAPQPGSDPAGYTAAEVDATCPKRQATPASIYCSFGGPETSWTHPTTSL